MRNLWSVGIESKPSINIENSHADYGSAVINSDSAGRYHFYFEQPTRTLMTENETNKERLYGLPNETFFVKDAFHHAVLHQEFEKLEKNKQGTKLAPLYDQQIPALSYYTIQLRLSKEKLSANPFDNVL